MSELLTASGSTEDSNQKQSNNLSHETFSSLLSDLDIDSDEVFESNGHSEPNEVCSSEEVENLASASQLHSSNQLKPASLTSSHVTDCISHQEDHPAVAEARDVIGNMASDITSIVLISSYSSLGSSVNEQHEYNESDGKNGKNILSFGNETNCLTNTTNSEILETTSTTTTTVSPATTSSHVNRAIDAQPLEKFEIEEDNEELRKEIWSGEKGIIEDWEPETSDSGSYIIGGSADDDDDDDRSRLSRRDEFEPEGMAREDATRQTSNGCELLIASEEGNEKEEDEEKNLEIRSETDNDGCHVNDFIIEEPLRETLSSKETTQSVLKDINDDDIVTPESRESHATNDDAILKMKQSVAVERLLELIGCCDFPSADLLTAEAATNKKSNHNIVSTSFHGDDGCDFIISKLEPEARLKLKLERWNSRLDKLLLGLRKTEDNFLRHFCHRKVSTSNHSGFSNDGFRLSGYDNDTEVGNDDDAHKPQNVVEFNRGMHCSDANQAHDILTTRYKLSDIQKKKSLISWSRWNVSQIVRGPHAQSPIWKPGFLEEVDKSKNVMEELNRSIESRETTLKKLADTQTVDFYTGLVKMCFERQQSNPDLRCPKKEKPEKSPLSTRKSTVIAASIQPSVVALQKSQENESRDQVEQRQFDLRSTSFSNFSTPPRQPQQSNHINCFLLKDLTNQTPADRTAACVQPSVKPTIIDFVKNNQDNQQVMEQANAESQLLLSQPSDEGFDDDDVFYRDDEAHEKHGREQNLLTQCLQKHHRSQPLINYIYNSQCLQTTTQQHRNKMKKRSQQRQRHLKNKLDHVFGKRDSLSRKSSARCKAASSRHGAPVEQAHKQSLICIAQNQDSQSKFSSLRREKKSATLDVVCVGGQTNEPRPSPSAVGDGSNVFSKLYHWFQDKVQGH